jgi:tetratricopeptide (TPR) repeat protein
MRMKKAIVLFVLMFLIAHFTLAQGHRGKGRVRGFVFDEDGNPLEGVRVKLFSLRGQDGFETATDADGKWVAAWIRGGKWNIDFLKVGYEPKKMSANISEVKRNPDIELRLKNIEGLVVTEALKGELAKGNKLFEEESYQEAIEVYQKILEKFPDAYAINRNIGNCYFQMKEYERAQHYYLKVLEKEPDSNEMKLVIGNCYANLGQDEKALEWYNKIKFEEIDNTTVLYNLGTHFYELSKFAEALRYYKRAVDIQNDFLDGIYQLGLTHLALGQYQESIRVFESYLKHDSDSERASQVEGFIDFLKKKIEKKDR